MKVEQVATLLNTVVSEDLGITDVVLEANYQNLIDVGRAIIGSDNVDKYVGKLVDRIGRTIFVNRLYEPSSPKIMKESWEYGSIAMKIDADMPDLVINESWNLVSNYASNPNYSYDQDKFYPPKGVRAKFFNKMVTYEVDISYTELQIKESFQNMGQLNAFYSMIETKIQNRFKMANKELSQRTINNMIVASIYRDFSTYYDSISKKFIIGDNSGTRAVNLLGLYRETTGLGSALTPETCLYDLGFLKFASMVISKTSDRMADMSSLFNIGGKQRFTSKDKQLLILHSDFARAADSYLQSDTFHDEYTKLPNSQKVTYWQGSGKDYSFAETSRIHISTTDVTASGEFDGTTYPLSTAAEFIVDGVIGVLADYESVGVCNENYRVPSHRNAKGEFVNMFHKADARYFNDYDENFIVFFVSDEPIEPDPEPRIQ